MGPNASNSDLPPSPQPADPRSDQSRLVAALALVVLFMVSEVVAAVASHSLALLSDAGHMLTDAGALVFAIVALRLATRPPAGGFTYGLRRTEVLSGLGSGVTLFVVGGLVTYEATRRLFTPPTVDAVPVLAVAVVGIFVNLLAMRQLHAVQRRALNVEGGLRHVMTDLYAFIGTAAAAVVILTTHFERADPLVSLLVAALMFGAAFRLLWDAGRVLLEAAPVGIDPDEIGRSLAAHPHVASLHDLHIWELTTGFTALSAHVLVHPGDDCHAIRLQLEEFLRNRFAIEHTTLQVDHDRASQVLHVGPLSKPG